MVRLGIILISILVYIFYFFVLSNCNPDSIEKYNNKYMRRKPYRDPNITNPNRRFTSTPQNNSAPNINEFRGSSPMNNQSNQIGSVEFGPPVDFENNNTDIGLEDLNSNSFNGFMNNDNELQDLFGKEVDPQSNIGNTF